MRYHKGATRRGFTLVEIMVAVSIIGLIVAIVIPNMISARQKAIKNACLANLRQLQGGLDVAALVDNVDIADLPDNDAIENVVKPDYIKSMPSCDGGGVYSTGEDGTTYCSVHYANPGGPGPGPT